MKKHNVLALVGSLALLANLLVPGLSLAANSTQTGTALLGCSVTAPSYSLTPSAAFSFTSDGNGGALTASISQQYGYKDPTGSALSTGAGTDYIEVNDVRDPSTTNCNNGLSIVLSQTDTFNDGQGHTIPAGNTKVLSSTDACPAGSTEVGGDVCIKDDALCGNGDGVTASTCGATDSTTSSNYDGTDFAVWASFPDVINQVTPQTLLDFPDNTELYGKAGLATSFAVDIPAGQAAGTYTVPYLYTLTVNP